MDNSETIVRANGRSVSLVTSLIAFFGLYWVASGFHEVHYSLFLSEKGLTGAQIGLVFYMLYTVTIVGGFVLGYLSDKYQSVKTIIVILSIATVFFSWVVQFVSGFFLLSFLSVGYGFFYSSTPDLADRIIMDSGQGKRYGLLHLSGSLGYAVGSLLAGVVLSRFGTGALFDFACICYIACLISTLFFPGDKKRVKADKKAKEKRVKNKVPLGAIFKNPEAYYIYGMLVIWGLVETAGLNYASMYAKNMGKEASLVSPLTSAAMIGGVCSYILADRIINKLGNENTIGLSFFFFGLRVLGITLMPFIPYSICVILCFIGGFGHPAKICAAVNLIVKAFPKEVSSLAQTLKNLAAKGIGSSVGAVVMGILIDICDFKSLYIAILIACALSSALFLIWGQITKRNRIKIYGAE